MEPVGLVSVVLGSMVLASMATLIVVDGIKRRSMGRQAISAIDGRWKKLKVEIPA
jgi:hypothetical protein